MEPTLHTDPALTEVLAELQQREPIFHRPEFGTTRADFERMTDPAFWEVGASGRRYSRAWVLDKLERRHAHPIVENLQASDFFCRALGSDIFLLTYTLLQDGARLTRRSTLWQRTGASWTILFHQGTIVQDAVLG